MQVLEQSSLPTKGIGTAAMAYRTSLTKEYAVKLFDSCSEVQAWGYRAIGLICSNDDCTYTVSKLASFQIYIMDKVLVWMSSDALNDAFPGLILFL